MISYDGDNFKFHASHQSSSSKIDVMHKPSVGDVDFKKTQNVSPTVDTSRMEMQLEATSQTLPQNSEAHVEMTKASKFEELSSFATSGRLNNSSQVVGVESKLDNVSSIADSGTWKKEISPVENSVSHEPRFHIGGSDCGTELSITSTLIHQIDLKWCESNSSYIMSLQVQLEDVNNESVEVAMPLISAPLE
ncbi:hypothetical protein IFM89_018073 [Coptis chinensis]|uniref:Uncharacterized protein n=1 Tax=Coptis chinensis TaxID=261450 RepID=A0A835M0F3_9MAGN|nr:hypothetical protein IFM89_018073 [Coptis chinensis]